MTWNKCSYSITLKRTIAGKLRGRTVFKDSRDPRLDEMTAQVTKGTYKMASSIGEESPSHTSTAKRPRIEKRQFLAAWKTEFPWVTYGHAEGMHCHYCIDAGKKRGLYQRL